MSGGSSASYVGDFSQRVTSGLEDKGFELRSDAPVTITIGCSQYRDQHSPDDMLLRPLSADDTDFMITSFLGSTTSSSNEPLSFFVITAAEDDTTITIYDNDNQIDIIQTLNR